MGGNFHWNMHAKEIDAKRILELGCGTGRVSIPLAKSGFLVNGIDLSKEMIEVFSSKLKNMDRKVQNNTTLIHTDMSDFSLNIHFDLIIIPFRAFQALTSEKQQA